MVLRFTMTARSRMFMCSVVWFAILYINLDVAEGQTNPQEMGKLKKYLGRYGYVNKYTTNKLEINHGLKQFQSFANLPVTGSLDAATVKQMYTPRCGLSDPVKRLNITRRRRYNHQGTSWKKNVLTWRYNQETSDLDRATVRRTMTAAMKIWSDKTDMEFKESAEQDVDIVVNFVEYQHDDPFSFDGVGGTLAHAYYPLSNTGLAGDVHFDDAERFTVNDPSGVDLMWVATHELGHSLGLEHTSVEGAVMYPYYQGYKKDIKLAYDDVVGIQTLYGDKVRPAPAPTKAPKPALGTLCPNSPITAVWFLQSYKLFVLITREQQLYFIRPNGKLRAGPMPARSYFPRNRVPGEIDSVFTHDLVYNNLREYTIVFSGSTYNLYIKFSFNSGPYNIHDGRGALKLKLPNYVKRIDSAFTWHKNGKVYLFSGSQYWSYDIITKRLDYGYPQPIGSGWKGVDRNVDAAYRSDTERRTLFFSGTQVYRINDRAEVERGYPKNVGSDLFHCQNAK